MKKMLLTVLTVLVLASSASALIRPEVRVTAYSATPALEPGGQTLLTLQLENLGNDDCADRVIIQLAMQYPLSITGPDSQAIGKICASTGAYNVSFPITADQSATLGNNPLTAMISYESDYAAQYSSSNTINLKVAGTPKLRAQITSTTPLDVHPGDTATVEITLDNIGSYKAQAIKAALNAPNPIEVKRNTQTAITAELGSKKSTKETYTIFVPKSAGPQSYALSLDVSYLDENSKTRMENFPLALYVAPKALFTTSMQDGNLYPGSNSVNVKFKVTNTGSDSARKLHLKLLPQYPFSTDGSERYMEQLDPSSSDTADFSVDVNKDATAGQYALKLQASFEDAAGQAYTDSVDVTLAVKQKDLLTVVMDYWFIWLALLIAAAVLLRGRLKKK